MLYPGFINDFCSLIPDVHIAMETSGFGNTEDFEKVLNCVDLFLFDIKVMNPEEHKKFCGESNELIFFNLDFLYKNKKKIFLRLPLIQGFNDTEDHFLGITELLRKYPEIEKAEILPFHNLGAAKAEAIGLEVPSVLPRLNTGKETIERWLYEFRSRDCENVFFA